MIKHKLTKKSDSQIELIIELGLPFIEPIKSRVLDKIKKNLKVAGFREGNIPDNIAEREIGEARLQSEVLEELINQSYSQVADELKLETITQPDIQIKKFVPFSLLEYKVEVSVMPEIKFDYKKLKIKEKQTKISEKDVSHTLESLRRQMAEKKPVKRPAEKGDELKLDFEGKRQGKPVEGASAQNQQIVIGDDQFIPGFEANLIGLKPNDEKEFTLEFPKDYLRKDLAGKKVAFKVKVHEIKEVTLPKLDNNFAEKAGNFGSLADLKEDIKLKLAENQKDQLKREYEHQVIDAVMSKVKLELPQMLLDQQLARLRSEIEQNLRNSGLDMQKYLQINKKTEKQLNDELNVEARKRITIALVLRYIIKQEKLTVSDKELSEEVTRLRELYKGNDNAKRLDDANFILELKNHLLSEKAVKKLINFGLGGKNL